MRLRTIVLFSQLKYYDSNLNSIRVYLFDDGSITTGTPIPVWNGTDLLTINIQSGVTKPSDIVTVLNNNTYTGSSDFKNKFMATSGAANSSVIYAPTAVTAGGLTTQSSTATITPAFGSNNAFSIASATDGSLLNGAKLYIYDDGSVTAGSQPVISWSSSILAINIKSGFTTANDIATRINSTTYNYDGHADFQAKYTASGGTGVISVPTGLTLNGVTDEKATGSMNPIGADNAFKVEAVTSGVAYNSVTIRLVDDGTDPDLVNYHALATFDDGAKILSIKIRNGITTGQNIVDAINNNATKTEWLASLATIDASNDGSGPIQTANATTSGGKDSKASSVAINPEGANNGFVVTADVNGTAWDGKTILFRDDGTVVTGQASASNHARAIYDSATSKLTIKIQNGVTTTNEIIAEVSYLSGWSAAIDHSTGAGKDDTTGSSNSGTGIVHVVNTTKIAGTSATYSSGEILPPESNNDISLSANYSGSLYGTVSVIFVNAATVGNEIAIFNATAKTLTIRISDGYSTANDVIDAINGWALQTTSGGSATTKSIAYVNSTGDNNDLAFEAKNNGSNDGYTIYLVNDDAITNNSATASYDAGSKVLTIHIAAGNYYGRNHSRCSKYFWISRNVHIPGIIHCQIKYSF